MSGRRDDDRRRGQGGRDLSRGQEDEYVAGRREATGREWQERRDDTGYGRDARGGDTGFRRETAFGREARDTYRYQDDAREDARDRRTRPGDWDSDPDRDFPQPRNFDLDRDARYLRWDRDAREFDEDRDFGRAARDLDRDEVARHDPNPERTARQPEYSPSGAFRAFQGEVRGEPERPFREGGRMRPARRSSDADRGRRGPYGLGEGQLGGGRDFGRSGGEVGRSGRERGPYGLGTRGPDTGEPPELQDSRYLPEKDVRYGGTEPGPHAPGFANMAPPRTGYATSTSRASDHDTAHGGYLGGGRPYRPATPTPERAPSTRTGRGPRSYQRSDERIREEICERLMEEWMDASEVDVHVKNGEVTLSGTVSSRDEKRAIEDVSEGTLGVKDVSNHLRVRREEGVMRRPQSQEPVRQLGADTEDKPLHS